jgi:hypothetical protein
MDNEDETATDIEWGVSFPLTNGTTTVEPRENRMKAWAGTTGGGLLVYRVPVTDWTDDKDAEANQFGVRRTWPNNHVEEEPSASRHAAEEAVRNHNGRRFGSLATVVSRQMGPWLDADTWAGH